MQAAFVILRVMFYVCERKKRGGVVCNTPQATATATTAAGSNKALGKVTRVKCFYMFIRVQRTCT